MDNWKLFAKSEDQVDTVVRTVHAFSTVIGMGFGMKNMWNYYHEERESISTAVFTRFLSISTILHILGITGDR